MGAAIDRKKLYEQVWSVPGSKLAVLYGISDVGLAKVCKRYNIPRPPRGYWARLAAGQRVRKPPLPIPSRHDEVVFLTGWDMPDNAIQTFIEEGHARLNAPEVSDEANLHPLAAKTRELLLTANPNSAGLVAVSVSALETRVSPAVVERCVDMWNRLIRKWESQGGTVTVLAPMDGTHSTVFAVGADSAFILLGEDIDGSKPLTNPSRLTGKLTLEIVDDGKHQFRRHWSDTKSQRLERLINVIVETLSNALSLKRRARLDEECVARQTAKLENQRKEACQKVSQEFYWQQELTQNVNRWHEAQRIRVYLDALNAAVEKGDWQPRDQEQFETWRVWATELADSIDPIINRRRRKSKARIPQNVPAADLDLTTITRGVVERLKITDTDALWNQQKDVIRSACEGKFGPVWNEISRVLETLGYDVSKRETASDWW